MPISIPLLGDWLKQIKKTVYDDFVDRLNYYVTTWLFLFFTATISAKQYLGWYAKGQPIQCWVPAEWRGGWEEFAEDYCFIQNTYYVPKNLDIPNPEHRDQLQITYYQWVPIVFALQAFMFYFPNLIWRAFCSQSGININSIMVLAKGAAGMAKQEDRDTRLHDVARYTLESIDAEQIVVQQGQLHMLTKPRTLRTPLRWMGDWSGGYVTVLYILTKVIYLLNIVLQYYIMASFIGSTEIWWGINIAREVFSGSQVSESTHFPRVTICDVPVRKLGQDKNAHERSIQCVLMINMFNDKVFLFFWFWLLFLMCVTSLNLLYWAFTMLLPQTRKSIAMRYLTPHFKSKFRMACEKLEKKREEIREKAKKDGKSEEEIKAMISELNTDRSEHEKVIASVKPSEWRQTEREFIFNALKPDGLLILRFVAAHAGDIVAIGLASAMIEEYMDRKRRKGEFESFQRKTIKEQGPMSLCPEGLYNMECPGNNKVYPTHNTTMSDEPYIPPPKHNDGFCYVPNFEPRGRETMCVPDTQRNKVWA